MKNWIFRTSALAFVAGLAGTLACGSSSSCGGTNINANTSTSGMSETCGPGTYMVNNTCYGTNTNGGVPATTRVNTN